MSSPPKVWKVQQYSYFWIASEVLSADQITALVGIEPNAIGVRGSRRTEPSAVPLDHTWRIECRRHARIDEQASEVLERIRPAARSIRALTDQGDASAGLMIVRYFDDTEGGYDAMGWALEPSQIALLAEMGARIEADEYLDNSDPASH